MFHRSLALRSMTESQKATQHRLLPTRRMGDTLIVTPTGSLAGYGAGEVNRELARLVRLLADPETKSLVIDLHGADYFGSEMVGIFVRLQQACRGATAIAGANHGMRKVFEVMRLDELFSYHASRRQALRAVATVPLRTRVHDEFREAPVVLRQAAMACVTLVVLWAVWRNGAVYQIFGSPVARDYCTLNDLWSDFGRLQEGNVSDEEELALRDALDRRLERLDARVATRRSLLGDGGSDEVYFRRALRCFDAVLHNTNSIDHATFVGLMNCARYRIEQRTGLELPVPASNSA